MSAFRKFMEEWSGGGFKRAQPYSLRKLIEEVEAMTAYEKAELMDLEDYISDRINDAIWETEAGEDI